MGLWTSFKKTFLPDAQTAADRRLKTFGTTSKVPAIAAAAVAAAVVATPGIRTIVGSTIIKHPIKSLLGTAIITGGGLKLIGPAFTTTQKATEIAVPIITGEKDLTPESFGDVAKTVGIIAGVGAVGAGIGIIGSKILAKDKIKEIPEKALGMASVGLSPILPERQTISPTKKRSKRRTAKKTPSVRQSVRVNIINRPVTTGLRITNKRYINERILN